MMTVEDAEGKGAGGVLSSSQSVGESPCSQVGADIGGQEERGTAAGEDAKQWLAAVRSWLGFSCHPATVRVPALDSAEIAG